MNKPKLPSLKKTDAKKVVAVPKFSETVKITDIPKGIDGSQPKSADGATAAGEPLKIEIPNLNGMDAVELAKVPELSKSSEMFQTLDQSKDLEAVSAPMPPKIPVQPKVIDHSAVTETLKMPNTSFNAADISGSLEDLLSPDIRTDETRRSSTNLASVMSDRMSALEKGKTEEIARPQMLETLVGKPNALSDELANSGLLKGNGEQEPPTKTLAGIASPARYEVDVRHYAQYDKAEDAGYSDETVKSLNYAAKTPFGRFVVDLMLILTRPGTFWKSQAQHPATMGQLYWPHLTLLIVLRTAAVMAGALFQHAIREVDIARMLVEAGVQALLIFLMIWVFSLIISGISTMTGNGPQFEKAHRFVAYSMTPIFVVGILSILPIPYMDKICDIIAMPWAFAVLGAGILPFMKIKSDQAPTMTGVFCGALLVMWGLIPLLIPRVIGLMM